MSGLTKNENKGNRALLCFSRDYFCTEHFYAIAVVDICAKCILHEPSVISFFCIRDTFTNVTVADRKFGQTDTRRPQARHFDVRAEK